MITRWSDLKLRHEGQTGLVIGNGPSLSSIPLSFLGRYPSIGTNRIYLLEGFTPTYYVAINPLVIEQSVEEISAIECEAKFIRAGLHTLIPDTLPVRSTTLPIFSRDPSKWVYEGFTVTYVALQLAFWLGFRTVLLVGVDHNYKFEGQPNEEHILSGPDPNHFSPKYFQGSRWHNPDLVQSEISYQMAQTVFTTEGRRIINITPGSKLDVFPKEDWRDFDD